MDKQIVKIEKHCDDQMDFIKLTKGEKDFLLWLSSYGYLDSEVDFEIMDEMPQPREF